MVAKSLAFVCPVPLLTADVASNTLASLPCHNQAIFCTRPYYCNHRPHPGAYQLDLSRASPSTVSEPRQRIVGGWVPIGSYLPPFQNFIQYTVPQTAIFIVPSACCPCHSHHQISLADSADLREKNVEGLLRTFRGIRTIVGGYFQKALKIICRSAPKLQSKKMSLKADPAFASWRISASVTLVSCTPWLVVKLLAQTSTSVEVAGKDVLQTEKDHALKGNTPTQACIEHALQP